MPIQKVNDATLYYEQHGTGPDLILIGGLTADHQVWNSSLRLFSKQFRVLTFDNRGAGQTTSSDASYTTEKMGQDVLQLMDALSISKAHIVGHSMGGCIAQQIALMAQDRINKLVLVCARTTQNIVSQMILTMREKLQATGVNDALLAEYMMPFLFNKNFLNSPLKVAGFIQWTLRNPNPQSASQFREQLAAVIAHDLSDELSTITLPTLFIAGSEDILMPATIMENTAKKLKNSTFVKMEGCAHMPHVEKSAEFAEIVTAFLK